MLQGTIAFFHPFADGGGGGERVLWCALVRNGDLMPCVSRSANPSTAFHNTSSYASSTLWACRAAVAAVQQAYPLRRIILYTGDGLTAAQLADRARQKFALCVRPTLQVPPLYDEVLPHAECNATFSAAMCYCFLPN